MSLLSSLMIGTSLANDTTSAVSIQKGTPAPFTGILLTEEAANQARRDAIERDGLVQITTSLEKTIQIQDLQIRTVTEGNGLLEKQNKRLFDALQLDKSMVGYERAIWFGLGVVLSGAAVYGASKIIQ